MQKIFIALNYRAVVNSLYRIFSLDLHFFRDLMVILKDEGRKLTQAQPTETVVGNMIRRGLYKNILMFIFL